MGGERFEVVLWSDCLAGFPERPESVLISVSPSWARQRIPLAEANDNSSDCSVNAPIQSKLSKFCTIIYLYDLN